jgi:hypothetical protein
MAIRLQNVSKKAFVVSLRHNTYCVAGATCACTKQVRQSFATLPTGETGVAFEERLVATSLRIEPGQTSGPLHAAVLKMPQIVEALKPAARALRMAEDMTSDPRSENEIPSADDRNLDQRSSKPKPGKFAR